MGANGIYGLSGSGLDIESLVKMGMLNKQNQYDKMQQKEIANTWLKEAYTDVYSDLQTYKYSTLSTYKMQSNLNAMAASSTNSAAVTATANGAAAAMNHTVTISSVASNAYLLTAQDASGNNYGVTRANTAATTSNKLSDVLFKKVTVGKEPDGSFTYDITLADGSIIKDVKGEDTAISLKLKDSAEEDAKEYTLTYTYDDLFQSDKTLNDFASAIAKTGANIQGNYDTANDSFSFYNKTTGKENIIGITADNANTALLLNNLNLGAYNSATNVLSDRISFTADDVMATTMESSGITSKAKSMSLKDVLGLKATSTANGDGSYTVSVADKDGNALGTFTKNADGTYTGADATAFAMNLNDGTNDATISFTLGELFDLGDIGKKSSLDGNASLSDLAAKINAAGTGAAAVYDVAKDTFSLTNPNGKADLTALGTGANKSIADAMINSLNLETSDNLSYKVTSSTNKMANVLGITSTIKKESNGTYTMIVSQGGTEIGRVNDTVANFTNGTVKNSTLCSFDVSDGTNSATVDLTYGDLINFDGISSTDGATLRIVDTSGASIRVPSSAGTKSVQTNSATLGALADKINDAATANGVSIKADYDTTSGQFSLLNVNGAVNVTNPAGAKADIASKLGLVAGDPDNIAYKTSKSITRVNAISSDDTVANALGLHAVKNDDGTLTIIDSSGKSSVVNASDKAMSLYVGDSKKSAAVELTYAELFDTTGSGTLQAKADMSAFSAKVQQAAADNGITVTASYDADAGKFSIANSGGYATLTGSDALGKSLVSNLGLKESAATAAAKTHSWAGTNAEATIDGKSYDLATNKITVSGVTYTFLGEMEPGQKATISVTQDTDKIVDYMKSFVEDYNKLLDSLNEKLSEQKYSDYKPLTTKQEAEMSEKQIDKWNEKAKSGLLYHNDTIRNLVSAMREAVYTKVDAVDSKYNSLSAIGITSSNVKGHLTFDEDKLRKALADDPDCVYQLFASDQDSSYIAGTTQKNKLTQYEKTNDYYNTGVSNRLYNVMTNYMGTISDIAGTSKDTDDESYLGKLITQMQTKMSDFKTQMTAFEKKLYKRYDAMEVALSRLGTQMSYITGSYS